MCREERLTAIFDDIVCSICLRQALVLELGLECANVKNNCQH